MTPRERLADALTDALVVATEDQFAARSTMRAIAEAAAPELLAAGWSDTDAARAQALEAAVECVMAARMGEADSDLRSIIHAIRALSPLPSPARLPRRRGTGGSHDR